MADVGTIGPSAVPARLGLEAPALAWPEAALASSNLRPASGKPNISKYIINIMRHGIARGTLLTLLNDKCSPSSIK